jgi:hypothetical protein
LKSQEGKSWGLKKKGNSKLEKKCRVHEGQERVLKGTTGYGKEE